MLNLIAAGATYLFPGGRALKLVKDGINVTNSTNPLILTKNITLVVVDCCAPPPLRLAAHCVAASVVSPNPVTIGSAIHVVTEIYENC
jgi:hypothetical protein